MSDVRPFEEYKEMIKDMRKEEMIKGLYDLSARVTKQENIIKEVREYIEENQEEHKYTDRGGFTYTEGHFLRDSETLLEILDDEKV